MPAAAHRTVVVPVSLPPDLSHDVQSACSWFDLDDNSSGKLATVLASDATYVRGAVADGIGMLLQVGIALLHLLQGCAVLQA